LEGFLANQRAKIALGLMPPTPHGRILDIGCGTYPLFLLKTDFSERLGLDKVGPGNNSKELESKNVFITKFDIETQQLLPYAPDHFDVVTMLAVFEHIQPTRLVTILKEIYRVLKPAGRYIMTTPAPWTDRLLRSMAKLHLVSPVEIQEHKGAYGPQKIRPILCKAGFEEQNLRFGYFEIFMNVWACATK